MLKSLSSNNRSAFDIVNIVAGLGLLVSPWLLGYATESYAAWNAWIAGAAIAVIAAAALYAFYEAEEWVNLVLGVWAIAAPWVLGFSASRLLGRDGRDVGSCRCRRSRRGTRRRKHLVQP